MPASRRGASEDEEIPPALAKALQRTALLTWLAVCLLVFAQGRWALQAVLGTGSLTEQLVAGVDQRIRAVQAIQC